MVIDFSPKSVVADPLTVSKTTVHAAEFRDFDNRFEPAFTISFKCINRCRITRTAFGRENSVLDSDPPALGLSNRENEVAEAYAAGQSYKEIARELGLSPTTVRSHLRTIFEKLGVTSKIELARRLSDSSEPNTLPNTATVVADLALELDDAVRRERSLAKVLRIISDQDGKLDAVVDAVLEHALEICEAEFGVLFEYLGNMRFRELRARNIPPAFAKWLAEEGGFEVEPETGLGRLVSQLQTINIADVRGEDVYKSGSPVRIATADLAKARSFAAIPMMSGNRLIGAFIVYRTRVHPFNERTLELAQVFADQAVIAIENVRQFR
jgi:DNA-binding CsgD family transcriptional regulator